MAIRTGAVILTALFFAMAVVVATILVISAPMKYELKHPELVMTGTENSHSDFGATASSKPQTKVSKMATKSAVKSHGSVVTTTTSKTPTKSSEVIVNSHSNLVTTAAKEPQMTDYNVANRTVTVLHGM